MGLESVLVAGIMFAPYASSIPMLDGVIDAVEWASASVNDISDTLARDGVSNPPGSCLLYAMHDEAFLYLAVDCPADTDTVFAQFTFFVDDNNSGSWPETDTTEGGNALSQRDSWMAAWFLNDNSWSGWFPVNMNSFSISNASGHTTAEWAVPLVQDWNDPGPQYIAADTGYTSDTLGLFITYYKQRGTDPYIAYWPQDFSGSFYEPAGFGDLVLLPGSNVQEHAACPRVWVAGVYRDVLVLRLDLGARNAVRVSLFDPTGRLVEQFARDLDQGEHTITIEPTGSGVFFLLVQAGHWQTRKTVVIR